MFTHSPLVHPFTPRSIFCTWRQLPRPQGPPQRGRGIGREAGDSLRGGVAHAATKICRCHQPALVRGSYSAVPLHVLVLGSPGSLAAILPRFYVGPRGCKDSAMCLRPHRHLRRIPRKCMFLCVFVLLRCISSPDVRGGQVAARDHPSPSIRHLVGSLLVRAFGTRRKSPSLLTATMRGALSSLCGVPFSKFCARLADLGTSLPPCFTNIVTSWADWRM